jgi:hypothetical protein
MLNWYGCSNQPYQVSVWSMLLYNRAYKTISETYQGLGYNTCGRFIEYTVVVREDMLSSLSGRINVNLPWQEDILSSTTPTVVYFSHITMLFTTNRVDVNVQINVRSGDIEYMTQPETAESMCVNNIMCKTKCISK